MSALARFKPKTTKNMIGNTDQLAKLKQNILDRTPTIVHGQPGIGKTSGVMAIANELNYKVIEVNASDSRRKDDIDDIKRRALMVGFHPTIYLFDEADGLGKEKGDKKGGETVVEKIIKILRNSPHSIVFTANKLYEVPERIKKECDVIRFFPPSPIEVVALTREAVRFMGLQNVRYDGVTGDVRGSLNSVLYGGEKAVSEDLFSITGKILRNQPFDIEMLSTEDRNALNIWLMDNIQDFYEGVELAEAYTLLAQIEEAQGSLQFARERFKPATFDQNSIAMYKLFPQGKLSAKVHYPSYFQRLSLLKKKSGEKKK